MLHFNGLALVSWLEEKVCVKCVLLYYYRGLGLGVRSLLQSYHYCVIAIILLYAY